MLLYAVEEWQGEIHANEHMALAWSPLVTLNHYPMPPADIPLIPALQNYTQIVSGFEYPRAKRGATCLGEA
jgi:hypothetical protein